MLSDTLEKLTRSLINHEGKENYPYVDTVGKITIGIGYNLTDRGLDDAWIYGQLHKDIYYFKAQLTLDFPWFTDLCSDRQIALIDMCFMGYKRFLEFKDMISAFEDGDFDKAADEMLNSEWAKQVKQRAVTLSEAIRTGNYIVPGFNQNTHKS